MVEEPSFIPDGDGRAIGQQNSSINLSPLHAETKPHQRSLQKKLDALKTVMCDFCSEKKPLGQMRRMPYDPEQGDLGKRVRYSGYRSTYAICDGCYRDRIKGNPVGKSILHAESRFDKLSNEIADEYEEKGMSPEKAQEVGDATAAMIGRKKYGKKGMAQMSKKGMNAEGDSATYSPSDEPDMVNEIQTSPTNESPQLFNASNTFNTTTALGIGGLVVAALSLPMLYSSAKSRLGKSAEEKRKSSGSVRKNHTQVKNSEYSVGQVNPVEAEGQQDIHGAEGITNPRHSPSPTPSGYPSKNLKMW